MTKKFRQLGATMGLLLLMVLLLISVYTYVLYQNFSRNMLEEVLTRDTTCADAIHRRCPTSSHGRILTTPPSGTT